MSKQIFLDLDGVLVDFVGGLHHRLGIPYSTCPYPYAPGNYDLFSSIAARGKDLKRSDIYNICHTSEFWASLDWDVAGRDILDVVSLHFTKPNIHVCTSPMHNPDAWAGKVRWFDKHLSKFVGDMIVTSAPKHLLARPGSVLLDDKDSNVEEFRDSGGSAFLIPQPWNKARHHFGYTSWLSDLSKFLVQP